MEENSNKKQKENNIQIRIFIVIIIILVLIIVGSWTCVYLLYKDNQNKIPLDEIIASKLDVRII